MAPWFFSCQCTNVLQLKACTQSMFASTKFVPVHVRMLNCSREFEVGPSYCVLSGKASNRASLPFFPTALLTM